MKTFVVFDRKTGELLQTHVTADDSPHRPEEILKMRPDQDRVAILQADEVTAGKNYKVDLKTNKLVAVEATKSKGSGGAFIGNRESIRTARTLFVDRRNKSNK